MAKMSQQRVSALAQVYAQSLYELADADGGMPNAETVGLELSEVASVARDEAQFSEFLQSPVISASSKEQTLRSIFGSGAVQDLVLRFLLVLNKKGRLDQLVGISEAYQQIHWDRTGKILVQVTSASPLDESLAEIVRERIGKVLGRETILETTVDESLLGGLRLKVGDRMIDASVASRLSKMRDALRVSGGETVRSRMSELLVD